MRDTSRSGANIKKPKPPFIQGDIGDTKLVTEILTQHQPSSVVNFAAESHVDRSISGPEDFIQTNIVGTFGFLVVKKYWAQWMGKNKRSSGFSMCQQMKFMVLWKMTIHLFLKK